MRRPLCIAGGLALFGLVLQPRWRFRAGGGGGGTLKRPPAAARANQGPQRERPAQAPGLSMERT